MFLYWISQILDAILPIRLSKTKPSINVSNPLFLNRANLENYETSVNKIETPTIDREMRVFNNRRFMFLFRSVHKVTMVPSSKVMLCILLVIYQTVGSFAHRPGQTDSQVNASLQNQNFAYGLRWIVKRILKLTQKQMTCDQLVSTCVMWPNGKQEKRRLARPKFTLASETQVKRKSKTCVDLGVRLART